jgi:hypothetical protein
MLKKRFTAQLQSIPSKGGLDLRGLGAIGGVL